MKKPNLKTIFWGVIFLIVAILFWYHLAGNPSHEFALIRNAQVIKGVLIDSYEDEQEDERGHVYFSDVGIYSFEVSDGRNFKSKTRVPTGQLKQQEEIEYLPSNPEINRIKGDGCQTITEFILRKILLGGILLVVFTSFGIRIIYVGFFSKEEKYAKI